MLLDDQTWTDLTGRSPIVVLPLGACEQHGPHLPLDTDMAVAATVAARAVHELSGDCDMLLAPPQPYSASGEHEGFPGTVSVGHEALGLLLIELGRSVLRWSSRLLIVNGHGGNHASLVHAVTRLRDEGRDVAWWSCVIPDGDAHAGHTETSLMLALRPDSVHRDRAAAGCATPLPRLIERLARDGVAATSPNGVLGDPRQASAKAGDHMLAELVAGLCAGVRVWRPDESGWLAPRPEGVVA